LIGALFGPSAARLQPGLAVKPAERPAVAIVRSRLYLNGADAHFSAFIAPLLACLNWRWMLQRALRDETVAGRSLMTRFM
jgi:hypothetical protein